MIRRLLYIVPVVALAVIAGLLWVGLGRDPAVLPSTLIDRPLPAFELAPVRPADAEGLATDDFTGRPMLLNVFASWCVPCIAEAPNLARLEAAGANIVGIAIRDRPEDAAAFLRENGNPFSRIGKDDISEVQLSLGSSGVPETFVIDGQGVIRYQHIGDIRDEHVPLLLEELRKAGG